MSSKMQQEKQKIMVPPMRYPLQSMSSKDVHYQLQQLNLVQPNTSPSTDGVQTFLNALNRRDSTNKETVFGFIPAPPHMDITKRVIGTDGYFFKMTTTVSEIDFIWHDRFQKVFLFWGASTFKVVKAMNSIRWRIHKQYDILSHTSTATTTTGQYVNVEDISDDEDDDDQDEQRGEPLVISSGTVPDLETIDLE